MGGNLNNNVMCAVCLIYTVQLKTVACDWQKYQHFGPKKRAKKKYGQKKICGFPVSSYKNLGRVGRF
jgi:hypothetical protein